VKYILFGGRGFIGTHFSNQLEAQNMDHVIYDIKDPEESQNHLDVRTELNITGYSENDVIVNLAAIHKTPGHSEKEYFETNILGAENVCNFARRNNINTILFTSSIAPYAASEKLKSEQTLPMPNTPYGVSKLVAEEIHKRWQVEKPRERKLIILRPGVVFGLGEGGNFTRLYQSLKKGVFVYPGRDDTLKACIYVKDLVNSMSEMAQNFPPGMHLLNMCYEKPYTIKEIVETMCKVTGMNPKRRRIPARLLYTISKLLKGVNTLLGWNILGIHPDRITKLMISTNISGEKLKQTGCQMRFSLHEAITDWFIDNNSKELR
jgi:GlcNAc-P-P-Und epimerase